MHLPLASNNCTTYIVIQLLGGLGATWKRHAGVMQQAGRIPAYVPEGLLRCMLASRPSILSESASTPELDPLLALDFGTVEGSNAPIGTAVFPVVSWLSSTSCLSRSLISSSSERVGTTDGTALVETVGHFKRMSVLSKLAVEWNGAENTRYDCISIPRL